MAGGLVCYLIVFSANTVYVSSSFTNEVPLPETKAVSGSGTAFVKAAPIYFTGDIMLGRFVETLLARNSIKPWDFESLFTTSTAVVTNFESAMTIPHIPTPSQVMRFSVDAKNLEVLEKLAVTHASLANNHAHDYGREGYTNTINLLNQHHITAFGDAVSVSTTSVTYIDTGSTRFGIIGIHTLFRVPTADELGLLISAMSSSSDLQLAYIHWGNEYELTHSQEQESFAKLLVSLGIDAVIGHHPHVTQDIQLVDGVPVFYSLGNFIFDQYFSNDVKEGFVLGLEVSESVLEFSLYPHYQCALSTPCHMDDARSTVYLTALANRSDDTLKEQIMAQKLIISR